MPSSLINHNSQIFGFAFIWAKKSLASLEALGPRKSRVFVRSWNDKPTGWYRAFQAQPLGSIQLAGREIVIRARQLRGERLRDAVTRAYAEKYDTKASEK